MYGKLVSYRVTFDPRRWWCQNTTCPRCPTIVEKEDNNNNIVNNNNNNGDEGKIQNKTNEEKNKSPPSSPNNDTTTAKLPTEGSDEGLSLDKTITRFRFQYDKLHRSLARSMETERRLVWDELETRFQ